MYYKAVSEINRADLEALLGTTGESKRLEFKGELPVRPIAQRLSSSRMLVPRQSQDRSTGDAPSFFGPLKNGNLDYLNERACQNTLLVLHFWCAPPSRR